MYLLVGRDDGTGTAGSVDLGLAAGDGGTGTSGSRNVLSDLGDSIPILRHDGGSKVW